MIALDRLAGWPARSRPGPAGRAPPRSGPAGAGRGSRGGVGRRRSWARFGRVWAWARPSCGPRRRRWPWVPAVRSPERPGRTACVTTLREGNYTREAGTPVEGDRPVGSACGSLRSVVSHAPASHWQSRSSGGDRWRGAEVQMTVIDKSVEVARRGRAGGGGPGRLRPGRRVPAAGDAQADAPVAAGRRGHVRPGVQGIGAGRLRAGRAGHLGAPAPAPGQALRRAGRPAAPARRRRHDPVGAPAAPRGDAPRGPPGQPGRRRAPRRSPST